MLDFVGRASSVLFGTATAESVNTLSDHVTAVAETLQETNEGMVLLADNFESLTDIVDTRFDHLNERVSLTNQVINNLWNQTKEGQRKAYTHMGFINYAIAELYYIMGLQHAVDDVLTALQNLISGNLDERILNYADLKDIIVSIDKKLANIGSSLRVQKLNPTLMYRSIEFSWTVTDMKLHILLHIPLVNERLGLFDVYQIEYFNTPVNASNLAYTRLTNQPPFLAINYKSNYFLYPSETVLKPHVIDSTVKNLALRPLSRQDCIIAIFEDNTYLIRNMCDFSLVVNPMNPELRFLHGASYLVLQHPQLFLECTGNSTDGQIARTVRPGCTACIFELPCFCALYTDKDYFPAKLDDCVHMSPKSDRHIINLAMLLTFKEAGAQLRNLTKLSASSPQTDTDLIDIYNIDE